MTYDGKLIYLGCVLQRDAIAKLLARAGPRLEQSLTREHPSGNEGADGVVFVAFGARVGAAAHHNAPQGKVDSNMDRKLQLRSGRGRLCDVTRSDMRWYVNQLTLPSRWDRGRCRAAPTHYFLCASMVESVSVHE